MVNIFPSNISSFVVCLTPVQPMQYIQCVWEGKKYNSLEAKAWECFIFGKWLGQTFMFYWLQELQLLYSSLLPVSFFGCFFSSSLSFRCATQSGCALQVSGLMSTAGKRKWSVVNVVNEIHTAAKEKINPELTVISKHMRGKPLSVFS